METRGAISSRRRRNVAVWLRVHDDMWRSVSHLLKLVATRAAALIAGRLFAAKVT
jgi:hypothetical protein